MIMKFLKAFVLRITAKRRAIKALIECGFLPEYAKKLVKGK